MVPFDVVTGRDDMVSQGGSILKLSHKVVNFVIVFILSPVPLFIFVLFKMFVTVITVHF